MPLSVHTIEAARALKIAWPDFYFSPQYGRIVESSDEGAWEIAVWKDGAILYPYLKRAIPDSDYFDTISPYGYTGIYIRSDQSGEDISAFRSAFRDYAREEGIVSEFLRMSAMTTSDELLSQVDPALVFKPHNSTLLIDLSQGYDTFFARAQGRARTAIRKARKLGYTSEVQPATRKFFSPDAPFRQLYRETMLRVNAAPYYFFSDDYFNRFYYELPDNIFAVRLRDDDGVVVMAGYVVIWQPFMHHHLVGSTDQALRDGAGNLYYDAMAAWGCEHPEVSKLHVGGGQQDGDSLYKFKLSFGGEPTRFSLGRSILDLEAYNSLTAERARALGVSEEDLRATGFFPSYRSSKPIVSIAGDNKS